MTPLATSKQEQDSEFLDMNDEDGDGDIDDEESDSVPQVAVDFPLPPSFTHPQPQPQAMTQAQAQAHAQAQASFARAHAQTHAQTQAQLLAHAQTRAQAQQEAREQAPTGPSNRDVATLSSLNTNTAAFRALPLLSSDLPYTQIQVSHSSIRPNDRGKEVVSFIIVVDPGQGKDIWKIEKLYSDVLSLDQRMRSSVGKGVGKKIGNLPEGKLWRDHAPAKVDQRKVCVISFAGNSS
jgi:RalA-binding protein 1